MLVGRQVAWKNKKSVVNNKIVQKFKLIVLKFWKPKEWGKTMRTHVWWLWSHRGQPAISNQWWTGAPPRINASISVICWPYIWIHATVALKHSTTRKHTLTPIQRLTRCLANIFHIALQVCSHPLLWHKIYCVWALWDHYNATLVTMTLQPLRLLTASLSLAHTCWSSF